MVAVLGSYQPQGAIKIQAAKDASIITKGDVLYLSSNKWKTAATGASGPFAVALETKAAADATISILLRGIVYVTADGAIDPNNYVEVSGSTAGQVVLHTTTASATPPGSQDVNAASTAWQQVVGIYLAHENEGDGSTIATAAADGDVIRVYLGGQ